MGQNSTSIQKNQQLILFFNPFVNQESVIDEERMKELALENDLEFLKVNFANGVPEEISFTPMIVYQNSQGRSIYYGRCNNYTRVNNFIRTSSMVPQKTADNAKTDLLLWENGRTKITAPIKLTELAGNLPKNFDQKAFIKQNKKNIADGFCTFKQVPSFNQTRTTKSFYFNLYPYLDDKDQLTISAEIFSQYNCVKPVWTKFEEGLISGKWKNRAELFKKAGELIELEIINQINSSELGDAFQAIDNDVAKISWADMGLAIEAKSDKETSLQLSELNLPKQWSVAKNETGKPIIIFSFLPPLDNYIGEAKALQGEFNLMKRNSLDGATGAFSVQIKDVTMGADDFDYEVQNKMLKMGIFPDATFNFTLTKSTESNSNGYLCNGKFKLLGLEIPLAIPATIEPFYNSNNELQLNVQTSFELPLFEAFKVAGPDGPSPAKDVLQYYMNFNLISK